MMTYFHCCCGTYPLSLNTNEDIEQSPSQGGIITVVLDLEHLNGDSVRPGRLFVHQRADGVCQLLQ